MPLGAEKIWTGRVVQRLRLALVAIVVLLLTSLSVTYLQYSRLSQAHAALLEQDFPYLRNAQKLGVRLTEILGDVLDESRHLPPAEIARQQQEFRRGMDALVSRIRDFSGLRNDPGEDEALRAGLDRLERVHNRKLERQAELWRIEKALARRLNELDITHARARDSLDSMLLETSARFQKLLRGLSRDTAVSDVEIDAVLAEAELPHAMAVLDFQYGSLITLLETSAETGGNFSIAELEARIRFMIRGVALGLSAVPPSDERRRLASALIRVEEIGLGAGGLVPLALQRAAAAAALAGVREEARETVDGLSLQISSYLQAADAKVEATSRDLEATLRRAAIVALSAAALIVAIVAGLVVVVIERQVNRRMARLTEAARDIASGNIDRPVRVRGTDELGDIAAALEVFKSLAQELTRSNADLQKFAYVASHDLRSPLKAIHDLASWTLEDAGELSGEHRENLQILVQRVNRLSALLRDLLEYARAGEQEASLGPLDLEAEVATIAEMLDPSGRFVIEATACSLPIETNVVPVRQVLYNLISNALKHHDREAGRITVTARAAARRAVITVADDGPGIARRYQERIFELFQTLRSRDEVEGSGLGLAIVSKLVDRYGGQIRVISDPSLARGTAFEFDIPNYAAAGPRLQAA